MAAVVIRSLYGFQLAATAWRNRKRGIVRRWRLAFLLRRHTGLAIACPVTNTDRSVPFHLRLPVGSSLTSFVMVDQVKSVDFIARKAKFIEPAPAGFLDDVLALLDVCIK